MSNKFVDYVKKVLDTDKNGRVNIKDLLALFPSNAVALAVAFVDVLAMIAEYRVWDVGYRATGGDAIKALGFVAVSAVPFLLGQAFWLNPSANGLQRFLGVCFVAGGLATSAAFGLSDLSTAYDINLIGSWVIAATVCYILGALLYVLADDKIKATRKQTVMQAAANRELVYQQVARSVLQSMQETAAREKALSSEFDDEAVQTTLLALRGGKPANPTTGKQGQE